ncbi:helix-turn-helix domain-containing protein [Pseudonocardia petroleophila]|uniref:Helix-turn-helix transcriptional regulator n=1 Tax=Pseudonocardia petroleophila TaxID=37331 RepID=A0A7G7MGB5_9PSEU|nr:helix-turn-helix domain-containing protein [Pseudonocardia petroleophila]QNG51826.1 helix-turn-helix transcriptional regulator [Pseudonocardia petroleophila]
MVLPRDYHGQRCSMARALEVVGERWSLLVVRDAFFGVRRFSDFSRHLGIPRAVLTDRLDRLVTEGVLERVPGPGQRSEYALTAKGIALWPVLRALTEWGDDHYAPAGPRRVFTHAGCGGDVGVDGTCARCGDAVPVGATVTAPGPGWEPPGPGADAVSHALGRPHPLLAPLP